MKFHAVSYKPILSVIDILADPDYVNNMSEEQQRWGGARDTGTIDMDAFRRGVQEEDAAEQKKKVRQTALNFVHHMKQR